MAVWPGSQQGAVSLTFDDGLESQLDIAIPMMAEHVVNGTFYVIPREADDRKRHEAWAGWRAAMAAGHEIGNHTVSHPCSMNYEFISRGEGTRAALESMTLEDLDRDIQEADRRLNASIPGHIPRSFAYPCYQTDVGAGADRQSYVPLIARRFVAGRARGDRANDPEHCDLAMLCSVQAERMSGAQMVGLVERAINDGRWVVFTFHGVDDGHLPIASVDLAELLGFVARHRDRVWTAPVAEVASAIAAWRTAKAGQGATTREPGNVRGVRGGGGV